MVSTDRSVVDVVDRAGTSPVVVHVPHSSRAVPAWADLRIGEAELAEKLDALTDAHADLIARTAGTGASLFVNRLSRLVVDPERFPDEREEMQAVGMGAVYTRGYAGRRLRDGVDEAVLREVYAVRRRVHRPRSGRPGP
jgi:N-formylglutamate amidohydrolase